MKLLRVSLFYTIIFLFFQNELFSQALSVGLSENIEDVYRRQQLLGLDSSSSSYMLRPINLSDRTNLSLDNEFKLSQLYRPLYESGKRTVLLTALPVSWQHQYNAHHPYGMNDGSMIPAKGYQTQLSTGFYAKAGPLSIQLRPEFVFSENKEYRELYEAHQEDALLNIFANRYYNRIDLPGRFGEGAYTSLGWGQSNIRLTFDPVSVGISSENLWWGPGRRNALLMSNNAPGFKHVTINTSRPVKTAIGSFEAQIIGGRVENSGVTSLNGSHYKARVNDWRYLSGMVFAYQPKWIPNLFLGFDRSFIVYHEDMKGGLGDYLPFFSSLTKKNASGASPTEDDQRKTDQYFSVFARWVLNEAKSELYFQYGRNDHPWNVRDAISEPEHSRGYIFGFRKLLPLNRTNEFIQIGLEVTQLGKTNTKQLRASQPWYSHYQVRDGYTNAGQVIGAGIGPGSGMQSLDVSWVKGLRRIGFQVERLVQNSDLLYDSRMFLDENRPWTDLSVGAHLDWVLGKIILNSQFSFIRSHNYQYQSITPDEVASPYKQGANNFQFKIGVLRSF